MTRARDIANVISDADLAGNIDVDGTTNLDAVDIDGAVDMASTLDVTGALSAKGGAVFNEDSADVDFRVESNGDANMLFVDGSNDRLLVRKSDPSNADQAFHLGAGGDDHKMILQGNSVQRIGLQNGTSSRVFLGAAADNHFRLSKQDASVLLDVNSSGNVILGQSNAGIHLGVTSATASNLLDDYEEGTFTPSFSSTNATFSMNFQSGNYTKVGRLVMCSFMMNLASSPGGTTSNTVSITGLPFSSATLQGTYHGGSIGHYFNVNLAQTGVLAYQTASGASSVELKNVGDNIGETAVLASYLGSNTQIRGQIIYHAA
jgi:prepilin-type processing-associated H-X9-DG protein